MSQKKFSAKKNWLNLRSEAIANLKHALHNLKIDATFPTQSGYLIDLLSLDQFKNNTYDTQWLDKKIANRDGQVGDEILKLE